MSTTDIEAPIVEDNSVDHSQDRAAIEAVIATVETAYNTNDADLMVQDVARNAVIGNAVGALQYGRDAVLEASRAGLAGFLKDPVRALRGHRYHLPAAGYRPRTQDRPGDHRRRQAHRYRTGHGRPLRPDQGERPLVDRGQAEYAGAPGVMARRDSY
ncbi:SgcJ/EcaC family oxidoreductase [Nocardia terpenica]|uniref:SgcJ/EcaC family oxidoreductase n=1 Tax=Nocardia terpenica TaxID=455432 RepID=UPI003D160DE8